MRQRYQAGPRTELLEATRGAAVKPELRGASVPDHLDVAPGNPLRRSRAERLHRRLLGGETGRQRRRRIPAALAVRDLVLGVDPMQEAVAVAAEHVSDAIDLGGVEPRADDAHVPLYRYDRQMGQPFDAPFVLVQRAGGRAVSCESLPFDHVFTTRDVDAGAGAARSADAWAMVGESLRIGADRLARARQVHAAGTFAVRAGMDLPPEPPEADILVSNDVSRAVTVRVADCAPVLLGDPVLGVVAAVHAGWRGTALGVAAVAVGRLAAEFGSRPENLLAAIGPCIGPDAYEVGEAVRDRFRAAGHPAESIGRWFSSPNGGRLRLDMWQANIDQLAGAGVRRARIHCMRACTRSHPDWFFSYRREGEGAGRMVAAIRPGSIQQRLPVR